jgi:hypothetical protein
MLSGCKLPKLNFVSAPGSPADIKVVVSSPQSLLVSWLPPTEPNGIITKYNLYTRYIYRCYWSVMQCVMWYLHGRACRRVVLMQAQVGSHSLPDCAASHSRNQKSAYSLHQEPRTSPTLCPDFTATIGLSFRMVDGRDELNHGKRNLPSQHTSFESKGLQQHVEYQFWVTASTRVGEGQSSRVVAQVPTVRGEIHGHCFSFNGNYVHHLL